VREAIESLETATATWCRQRRHISLLVVALALITAALAARGLAAPLRTDYVAMLTGADVLHAGGCLYCHTTQLLAQQQLLHQQGIAFDAFLEPPLVAALYIPLLALPATAGFTIVLSLSAASIGGAALLTRRATATGHDAAQVALLALAFLSIPAAWIYALGQTDAPVLLALAAALWLRCAGRPSAAGVALAVACLKPQTAVLALPMLAVAREWRMLAWTLGAGAALAICCLLLAGPGAAGQWLSLAVASGPQLDTSLGLPSLGAWIAGSTAATATTAGVVIAGIAVAWRQRAALRTQPDLVLAAGVSLSVLAAPHVYPYDLAVLAVPLMVMGRRDVAAALVCALALNAAHLIDTFFVWSGPHLETVAVLWLLVRLSLLAGRQSAGATAVSAHRSTASDSCDGVVSAFTR
jgi:Glycosyltransferase family 87